MTRKSGGSYRDINGNEGQFTFSLQCYGREYSPEGRQVIRNTKGPHGRSIWFVEDQLFMPLSERESALADAPSTAVTAEKTKVKGAKKMTAVSDIEPSQIVDRGLTLTESLVDESWKEALAPFLQSEKFERLSNFVESERRQYTVYPLSQDVFSALNACPFDNVKVVIIGQDPYHGPGQGHGLAFSVQKGVNPPPSLKNIFKELVNDEGIAYPEHGNLESWARQGVLLLNTVLTVRRGEANSHSKMGWENFSDEIVEALNGRKEGLVFLLWGAPATKKGSAVDKSKHTVIATSHPSPLGATKTNSPFLVSNLYLFVFITSCIIGLPQSFFIFVCTGKQMLQ